MKSVIIIPTYNEKENIVNLIGEILKLNKGFQIIIVDDNSPDGTGEIADKLSFQHKEVEVIHRKGKLGFGTACIQGFKHALSSGADYIFEIDADFSHDPKELPVFLESIQKYDLVIGSRYINGISVVNWELWRLLLSKAANQYVRLITGLPISDVTTGFRCFKRRVLEKIDLDKIRSMGYSFLIEITYRVYREGFRIKEIPIIFENRRKGQSKLSKKIAIEAFFIVWRLQFEFLKKYLKIK